MKTFDSKIANNSQSSFIIIFNSISSIATMATFNATVATKMLPLKRVVARVIFDFIFQTSRNGRNENDKNQSL